MKFLLTGLALITGLAAGAQANRVSIGINQFGLQKLSNSFPDREYKDGQETLTLLPSVGYYRTLNRSFGVGIEIGYGRMKETYSQSWSFGSAYSTQEIKTTYDAYYICPTVFETYDSRNGGYKFIASLSLPVSYSAGFNRGFTLQEVFPNTSSTSYGREPTGDVLKLGLFANGSVQRRLAGGLFICPQLGVGGIYSRIHQEGTQVTVSNRSGQPTQQADVQISNIATDFRFEFRPTLALNYYF